MSDGGHIGVQVFQTSWFTKNPERIELPKWNLDLTRVRYIENLDLTHFWENNHIVCYIEVWLMINFQLPVFQDLKWFCYIEFLFRYMEVRWIDVLPYLPPKYSFCFKKFA